ncbi:LOW QUALITY PROTEIN: succinyl-CoA:3-ketoacid coenzyme A transferase 2, mitochondrial [Molossus nigricans]
MPETQEPNQVATQGQLLPYPGEQSQARSRCCLPFLGQKAPYLRCPSVRDGGQVAQGHQRANASPPWHPSQACPWQGPSQQALEQPSRAKGCICGSTTCTCAGAKFYTDPEAVKDISDGANIMVGEFGLCGTPQNLIGVLLKTHMKDLTVISNGMDNCWLDVFLVTRWVTHISSATPTWVMTCCERELLAGALELEITPRAPWSSSVQTGPGGAGVPAFYMPRARDPVQEGGTPIGYDHDCHITIMSQPRQVREFLGQHCFGARITVDFALVKGWKGNRVGNVISRNVNVPMCKAAETSVEEVEEIVDVGSFTPEDIHVPDIYVDHVIQEKYEKRIEPLTLWEEEEGEAKSADEGSNRRTATLESEAGMYANVGIGIPLLGRNYTPSMTVHLHRNGIPGSGPFPLKEDVGADLTNAGKQTVAILPGAVFSSDHPFAVIRGHTHLTMLGAMQVSRQVTWKKVKGMGAMDLVSSIKARVVVTVEHCTKAREPTVMEQRSVPLTGERCVARIIVRAVFDVHRRKGLVLVELREAWRRRTPKGHRDRLCQLTRQTRAAASMAFPLCSQNFLRLVSCVLVVPLLPHDSTLP